MPLTLVQLPPGIILYFFKKIMYFFKIKKSNLTPERNNNS